MGGKIKYPRALAIAAVQPITRALASVCEKLIVAGSLRRRKDMVGDAEILYVPKFEDRPDPCDLLGNLVETNLADEVIDDFLAQGVLARRAKQDGSFMWGGQNKMAVHVATGIPIDLFECRPGNWWTLLVCRTGSKENNERICNAAIAKGMKWNPYIGFVDRATDKLLHAPRSEQDVFARVGLPWLEPWER
jgi:DNA polymerase/3'-5' exonuclease PolX